MHLALLCAVILNLARPQLANAQSSEPNGSPIATTARDVAASTAPEKTSAAATAQEPGSTRRRLQLGVALKSTTGPGGLMGNELGPSFIWRWRSKNANPRQDDRFAFAYRLSAFGSQVSSALNAGPMPIGDVKIRPLMVGFDYKMPRGKWEWSAGLAGGWAVNNIDTPGDGHPACSQDSGRTGPLGRHPQLCLPGDPGSRVGMTTIGGFLT